MLSPALLKNILSVTKGKESIPIAGSTFSKWSATDSINEFLQSGILQEVVAVEEISCSEQCDCDEPLLKVRRISDDEAVIYCPIGNTASKRVSRDSIRQFRFSRVDFLIWLSKCNGWEIVDDSTTPLVTSTYQFAWYQESMRRSLICFAVDAGSNDFKNRMNKLRSYASPQTPVIVLCAEKPNLTLDESLQLSTHDLYAVHLEVLWRNPTSAIDLSALFCSSNQMTLIKEPALILQHIATGSKRGFVTELAGRLVQGESIPLGRSKLALLHTMMHAPTRNNGSTTFFEVTEKELTDLYAVWLSRGWVTANVSRASNLNTCVAQQWDKLIRKLRECNLDQYFSRLRENSSVFYRLLLSPDEVSCRITNLESDIMQTANSGRRT